MAELFNEVKGRYAEKKKLRKLNLVPQEGFVTLDIELKDGNTKEFTVKPLQAAIISMFDGGKPQTNFERQTTGASRYMLGAAGGHG